MIISVITAGLFHQLIFPSLAGQPLIKGAAAHETTIFLGPLAQVHG